MTGSHRQRRARRPSPSGVAVTESRLGPDQARRVLKVIQADISRLPVRLRDGSFSHPELLIQLANDVSVLADVVADLIDALEIDSSARASHGQRPG